MGLGVDEVRGRRSITHGGGINGFLSDGRYYPAEELIVVVLQNSTGPRGPAGLGATLATLVLGPLPEPPPERAFEGDFGALTGTYSGPARGTTMTVDVLVEDGRLALRIGEQSPQVTRYAGGLRWEVGGLQATFVRRADRVDELRMDYGGGHYVLRRTGG
jgi:hypothetical protein